MNQRYKYEFERVVAPRFAIGAFKFNAYQEKIMERAVAGWRFVTAVVPPEFMTPGGGRAYLDLVFEAPVDTVEGNSTDRG